MWLRQAWQTWAGQCQFHCVNKTPLPAHKHKFTYPFKAPPASFAVREIYKAARARSISHERIALPASYISELSRRQTSIDQPRTFPRLIPQPKPSIPTMSQAQKRKAGAASQPKLTTPKKGRGRPSLTAAASTSGKKGAASKIQKAPTGGKGKKTAGKRLSAASASVIERQCCLSTAHVARLYSSSY